MFKRTTTYLQSTSVDLELSLFFGDDVAIGSNFPDVSSSIVVFRWCFGSDLVLFLKNVNWNAKSLQCDGCDIWYHTKCSNVPPHIYKALQGNNLSWIFFQCGLPNFSTTFFETEERIEMILYICWAWLNLYVRGLYN
jgi:hypothetical protein